MPRNLLKYGKQGKSHINTEYDLTVSEMDQLCNISKQGIDGLWDALITSYYCGFEAGRRQTLTGMKGGRK